MKNCTLICLAVVVLCCSLSGCGQRKRSADIRSNWNNINIESRHRKHDGMQQDFGEPHCPSGFSNKGWC